MVVSTRIDPLRHHRSLFQLCVCVRSVIMIPYTGQPFLESFVWSKKFFPYINKLACVCEWIHSSDNIKHTPPSHWIGTKQAKTTNKQKVSIEQPDWLILSILNKQTYPETIIILRKFISRNETKQSTRKKNKQHY